MITQKELKRILKYKKKTGEFFWRIKPSDRISIGSLAGTKNGKGYIQIGIKGKLFLAHRLAWLYVYGYFPEKDIDHKDRIRVNNWISNLREASEQCNSRNTGNNNKNTSGVKGVYWHKRDKIWRSSITINGKIIHIGSSKDFIEAISLHLAVEQCIGWEGCDSSSPAYQYMKNHIIN